MTPAEAQGRIEAIQAAFPPEGLFAENAWHWSPEPFPLPRRVVRDLVRLGPVLRRFQQACNLFYHRSINGTLPLTSPTISTPANPGR